MNEWRCCQVRQSGGRRPEVARSLGGLLLAASLKSIEPRSEELHLMLECQSCCSLLGQQSSQVIDRLLTVVWLVGKGRRRR